MAISSLNSVLLAPSLGLDPSSGTLSTPPRRTNQYISHQEQLSPPSPLMSKLVGRSHAFSINGDHCVEQGRITMQTRVAVRDTTPHRFQIIPLRDTKKHCNYDTETESLSKHCKPSIHLERSFDSEAPSLLQPTHVQSLNSFLPNLSDGSSPSTDEKSQDGPNFPRNGSEKVIRRKGHVSSDIRMKQNDTRLRSPTAKISSHHIKFNCSHTMTPDESNLPTCHYKDVKLGNKPRKLSDCYQASSEELSFRLNSEDFTPHKCSIQQERHGHMQSACSENDLARCLNSKRHAIYAGSMVLPFFERAAEPDTSFPGLPSTSRSSINHTLPSRHCCSKARCFEDIFGRPSNRRVPTKTGLADTKPIPRLWTAALPKEFVLRGGHGRSVPRLRPARRTSDSSIARARAIPALNIVHELPVRHSHIILDLLNQLDQAIEDWTLFERDSAYWIPVRSSRGLHF